MLTYGTFGWTIASNADTLPQLSKLADGPRWGVLALWMMVLGAIATYPTKSVQVGFTNLFSPNVRALMLILGISLIGVIMLTWTAIFVDSIVLMAAALLLSLDLKLAGWSKLQRLFAILLSQLGGFYLGIGIHEMWVHPEYVIAIREWLSQFGWYRDWVRSISN
jgi:ABC-type multidrug transport system fused ATPase/permease subunit